MVTSEKHNSNWFVYMIETKDETLYTGITNDLEKRWQAHLNGSGAKYLRAHEPKKLVYIENANNRSDASKREAEIKKLKRVQKLQLIVSQQNEMGQ